MVPMLTCENSTVGSVESVAELVGASSAHAPRSRSQIAWAFFTVGWAVYQTPLVLSPRDASPPHIRLAPRARPQGRDARGRARRVPGVAARDLRARGAGRDGDHRRRVRQRDATGERRAHVVRIPRGSAAR